MSGAIQVNKLLIIFSLTDRDPAPLIERVKSYGDWGIVSPRAIFLETSASVSDLITDLQHYIDRNSDLAIFTVSAPWTGQIDPIVEDLISSRIGTFQNYFPKSWEE